MPRKPSLAGLKRELEAAKAETDRWHTELVSLRQEMKLSERELDVAKEKIADLEDANKKLNKQVAWYERQREETYEYFDRAIELFRPHLLPSTPYGGIETPENSLDRFLLKLRERLSRFYAANVNGECDYVYRERYRR